MFEATLLPQRKGWEATLLRSVFFGSLALQAGAVAAFIVVPLLYPDKLPAFTHPPKLTSLTLPRPTPPPVVPQPKPVRLLPATSTSAPSAPAARPAVLVDVRRGGMLSHAPSPTLAEPLLAVGGGTMAGPPTLGSGIGSITGTGTGLRVVAAAPASPAPSTPGAPMRISSGVSAGMLLAAMRPIYPRMAVLTHTEGTVIVAAVIDRTGKTTEIRIVSGPEILRQAAEEAVRDARYKPFLLNGQPTEVTTTVSVTFRMS